VRLHSASALQKPEGQLRALTRAEHGGPHSADLRRVIEEVLAPYVHGDRLRISGPAMTLSSEGSLFINLALHELATNAAKYGAL
jgi:two-component sensor histidine kinase